MHTLEQLHSGELKGIQRLQLRCGLTEFPREIFELADSLEILDLSGNQLSALPDDLPRLHKLRVIFCSDNPFTELPEVLGQCTQLSMVGFKANRIAHVSNCRLRLGNARRCKNSCWRAISCAACRPSWQSARA